MKQKLYNPKLMLALSMVIFGTLGPFTRNIAVSSGELALYRAVMAAVMIGLFLRLTKQKLDLREIGRELPLLLLSGVAMGFNWILLFQAYQYTTISVATLSYYFAPVIVTIASPLLFREKLTKKGLICFLMSTVGMGLIIGVGNVSGGERNLVGILYGFGAAVLYATVILLNKAIKGVSGIHRTFLQFIAAVLVLIPYVLLTSGMQFSLLDTTGWVCLLVVGIVHTGITYCLYFSSLKDLSGQQAAILSYIDPLVAVLVSLVVLKEAMTPLQILGGVLILGFTLWNEKN